MQKVTLRTCSRKERPRRDALLPRMQLLHYTRLQAAVPKWLLLRFRWSGVERKERKGGSVRCCGCIQIRISERAAPGPLSLTGCFNLGLSQGAATCPASPPDQAGREKRSEKRKRRPHPMVGMGWGRCLAQCILQEARWLKDAARSSAHIFMQVLLILPRPGMWVWVLLFKCGGACSGNCRLH